MKTNEKRSKKLRGMTLVEIVVALAVLAVLALLLAIVGKSVESYRSATRRTNQMVSEEAPIAENQNVHGAYMIDNDVSITVQAPGMAAPHTVQGKLYDTNPDSNVEIGPDANGDMLYAQGDGKSLKYIYIPTPSPAGP